jgi:hypothetical protein
MKQERKSHRVPLFKLPIDSKADELERKIAEAVHNECQRDLAELEQAGIPPMFLVVTAIQIATKRMEIMPEDLKERFRERADAWKQMAAHAERISCKSRALSILEIKCLKANAESMRNGSRQIGRLLKRFRKDHDEGVAILVHTIQTRNKDFDSWSALKQVLATAFNEAGIESKHITADNLRKTAERYQPLSRYLTRQPRETGA